MHSSALSHVQMFERHLLEVIDRRLNDNPLLQVELDHGQTCVGTTQKNIREAMRYDNAQSTDKGDLGGVDDV